MEKEQIQIMKMRNKTGKKRAALHSLRHSLNLEKLKLSDKSSQAQSLVWDYMNVSNESDESSVKRKFGLDFSL